ncbi:MAG: class II aldolase/adducin family protein [Chloroflexota bacterium]|nr:class II aldolase/adducin family protein [Chloroflexota bacterium]
MASTLISPKAGPIPGTLLAWFTDGLRATMRGAGHQLADDAMPARDAAGVALHPVDVAAPHSYRRRSRAVFVVGIGEVERAPDDLLRTGYPLLLRTLGNIFVLVAHQDAGGAGPIASFFTLEQGTYSIQHRGDDAAFFAAVVARLAPLATSRLVIDNDFHHDLPESLWHGDEHSAALTRAGQKLDELDLLPAPFPLEDFLSPRDFRHVRQLFNIGGLSYGNLSQRRNASTFWMSASGVDKSKLRQIGRDILLVTGFDAGRGAIQLSVPPAIRPRRVSVDAIEHIMIYREHPAVGAILHIHAWMDGIPSTAVNYPCGTEELAVAVAELVRQAPDPAHAVVGLKNHGLTITGESLDEIFLRTEGKILRQVPMT